MSSQWKIESNIDKNVKGVQQAPCGILLLAFRLLNHVRTVKALFHSYFFILIPIFILFVYIFQCTLENKTFYRHRFFFFLIYLFINKLPIAKQAHTEVEMKSNNTRTRHFIWKQTLLEKWFRRISSCFGQISFTFTSSQENREHRRQVLKYDPRQERNK